MVDAPTNVNNSALDAYVLEVLKRRSPNRWSTARDMLSEILIILIANAEDDIQAALDRLRAADAIKVAFNNVGDRSYTVYRTHKDEEDS